MNIPEEMLKYLNDNKFSNGFPFVFPKQKRYTNIKLWHLISQVKNKRVIHFGCADHIPLIEHKIRHDIWTHKKLTENSIECIGLDSNSDAITFIKKLGFDNVVSFDLFKDSVPSSISETHWDLMIIGDVLEHIDNPVLFLQLLREKFKDSVDEAIFTVPSAFSLGNFKNAFFRREIINTDHRYWFSPYTLAKVITKSGFYPTEIKMTNSFYPSNFFIRQILNNFSYLCDSVVLRASFNPAES